MNLNLNVLSPKRASLPGLTSADHVRRLRWIFLGVVMFGSVLAVRLVQLQAWGGQAYVELAEDQHHKNVVLEAARGRILDRRGREIACNFRTVSLFRSGGAEIRNPVAAAATLSRLTGLDKSALHRSLTSRRGFTWLARKLDYETLQAPEFKTLSGIQTLVDTKRHYPMGPVAGHLLGYTDIDNVGIEGGELGLDRYLRGQSGIMVSEVDALGRALAERGDVLTPPENGSDVTLTIDADCQWIAEEEVAAAVEAFGARAGVAVVLIPRTGEILALAGVPGFDPNRPADQPPENRRNRAITDMYEPGSTFKIVAAAAALNERILRPDQPIFCENGRLAVSGGYIRDSHPHQWLTFSEVIEQSSNIGTIKTAWKVGEERLYEYAKSFGFAGRTGIALPGEAKGLLRRPSAWSKRSLETIAIGQEVLVTPLQLALAYGAVANGGVLMKPQIIKSISRPGQASRLEPRPEPVRRVIDENACRDLVAMLKGVVARGTGRNAAISGLDLAGKTGTAQCAEEGGRGYEKGKYISSFVGFLPADDPQLLCLVTVDRPTKVHWGSSVAAPTFRRIVERVLALRDSPWERPLYADASPDQSGPPTGQMRMPNLVGLSLRTAQKVLERYGLAAQVEGGPAKGQGYVVEQSAPEEDPLHPAGALALRCEQLRKGDGPAGITVPDLTGLPLRKAVTRLSAEGLRPALSGEGFVAAQAPAPGSCVRQGTACSLVCRPSPAPAVERPAQLALQMLDPEMHN